MPLSLTKRINDLDAKLGVLQLPSGEPKYLQGDVDGNLLVSISAGSAVMEGVLDDVATTAAVENAAATVRITAQRAIHSNLRNNSGTEIGIASSPLRIDPTGITTQPISGSVSITAGPHNVSEVADTQFSGFGVVGVRHDADDGFVDADGDFTTFLFDDKGRLKVRVLQDDTLGNLATEGTLSSIIKAEDASHASGDKGVMALSVRSDTPTSTSGTSGDYSALITASDGKIWARITQYGTSNLPNFYANVLGVYEIPVTSFADPTAGLIAAVSGGVSPTDAANGLQVVGNIASGATDAGKPNKIGGVFNTTQPTVTSGQRVDFQATSRGAQIIMTGTETPAFGLSQIKSTTVATSNGVVDGGTIRVAVASDNTAFSVNAIPAASTKATYSAAVTGLATAATATDIFAITGSASKTVKITQIGVSGTSTTAITTNVLLIRRSTADSGGTSTTETNVKHDTNDSAATAVVKSYTANPTLGTGVGTIRTIEVLFPLATAAPTAAIYDFGIRPGEPIVLRGTSEQLVVNLNSITILGSALSIWCEFTEE